MSGIVLRPTWWVLSAILLGGVSILGPASREAIASIAGPPQTDGAELSISSITVGIAKPLPGEQIPVDLVVRNTQPCPNCSPAEVSYWDDSADGALVCGDGRSAGQSIDVSSETSETTIRVVLDGYPRPGTYRAWFWVDCQQAIFESDEANNRGYADIVVVASRSGQDGPGPTDPVTPDPSTPPVVPTDPVAPTVPDTPVDPSDPVLPSDPAPTDPTLPDEPGPTLPDEPGDDGTDVGGFPAEEPDNGEATDTPGRPGLCGLLGGQSGQGLAALLGVFMLGLMGMKRHGVEP